MKKGTSVSRRFWQQLLSDPKVKTEYDAKEDEFALFDD